MEYNQLVRQLQLIEMLASPRGRSIDELSVQLECSPRTVYRDLRCLEEAGIAVQLDSEESSYNLAPDCGLVAARLFGEELLALAMVVATSPLAQSPAMRNLLEQALGKITNKAPVEQKEQIARVVRSSPIASTMGSGHPGVLRSILQALCSAAPLRVSCRTSDGKLSVHDGIIPESLHLEENQLAFGYRTGPKRELVVLPIAQVIEVQACGNSTPVMSRHLLQQHTQSSIKNGPASCHEL